jgi:hypothetical protein
MVEGTQGNHYTPHPEKSGLVVLPTRHVSCFFFVFLASTTNSIELEIMFLFQYILTGEDMNIVFYACVDIEFKGE